MTQGKLRSGVYRSFIMCEDPRGVVECGAIKKQSTSRSSICSGTNQRFDHPSKAKERSELVPRKSTEGLQILRVSKGIQKLNVAFDSWSSYETVKPEDIAKGLLRGALDLEESLAMLGSIQEDDIKQKPRISKDGKSDLRSMSDRFGERIEKRMMSQENVASRDCYEELRKVIRESFLRQNLLPQTTTSETKTRVVRSEFACSSGAASQSCMVSSSTKSSDIPRRAPSLIARLMGFDVSPQEPNKITVKHIDKPDIVNMSLEKLKKKKKKESQETRETVLQSLPEENPSTIVLIKSMRVVVQPGNKRPVLPKKPRMQGEVHPRMINQRKDHQVNKMNIPSSLTKKDREENGGKMMKLMSPSNAKAVTRERTPLETNKNKKEDIGKERYRPHNPATCKKSNTSSETSRDKSRGSGLNSSSSSDEQKCHSRVRKSGEASGPSAKNKLHQPDNDFASKNNSSSSQDTRGSINQLSAEETTSSEFNIQGHCDNGGGEVSSCPAAVQPETSKISIKSFLSNSSDFISYAENLFDFNTNTKGSQNSTFQNRDSIVISDQRLALDFAKDVARRRSLLLITEPTCPQRSSLHIDELLMEVCDEFDSLISYRDAFLGQGSFLKESVHLVLEKDLKSKKTEITSGGWDLGWRSEFQMDETHQAVVDLERLILSALIQEVLSLLTP